MVIALADLSAMVTAIMAILILLAAALLIKLIVNMLPDWHIPGFSSIRGWAVSASDHVVHDLSNWLRDAARFIGALFVAPVHFVTSIVDGLIDAAMSAYRAIWHTVTYTIPHAISVVRAEIAHDVAIIDIQMHNIIQAYERAVATAEADAAVRITAAETALTADVAAVRAWATSEIDHAVSDYRHLIAAAAATATAEIAAALRTAESEIVAVDRQLSTAIHATATWAQAEITQALEHAERFATDVAHTAAADAIARESAAVASVTAGIWQGVMTDVDAAIHVAGEDFADVVEGLKAIPRTIEADIPATIAAVAAATVPMLRIMRDCTMPNCRNLSGLGNLLHDLLSDATDVAIVAMLADLVHDPTGAATEIRHVLGPIADATTGAAKTLVGV